MCSFPLCPVQVGSDVLQGVLEEYMDLARAVCELLCDLMSFRSFKQQQELLSCSFLFVEDSVLCCSEGTLRCWSLSVLAGCFLLAQEG